jgi:hypothetical protein
MRLLIVHAGGTGLLWTALLLFGLGEFADADELVLPQAAARDQSIEAVYRFTGRATGHGALDIEWSDVAGRVVEKRRIPIDVRSAAEIAFPLDLRRAVTMKNRVDAHLSFDAADAASHREEDHSARFIASPTDRPWSDYQIIMWQAQTRAGYAALKRLGITAGMLQRRDDGNIGDPGTEPMKALLDTDLRFYIESIATDFYSPYHRWSEDRPPNWRFIEAKERYWKDPHDRAAFIRQPSLSDPDWLQRIRERVTGVVRAFDRYRPLDYNLGDEPGIADLAAFWDFDFSTASLTAMRDWLRDSYGSLAALNRQWGTAFDNWQAVLPMTTDEAVKRTDENYSAWADFKQWMDVAFARAVMSGTTAVHAARSDAISAIEGAQIPGWGGYDYSRLARSVDAMEIYDFGDNVEIARSFNANLILLTTSGGRGRSEAHRVWRELLRGTRGLILWDEKHEFVGEDGGVGDRGREAAEYFSEIRGGLGALLIGSRRYIDPVAILYSPASMRIQWLLDRRAAGDEWSRRSASTEYQDDAIRAATRSFVSTLRHMGLQHRFVSSAEIARGELVKRGYRVLILPHAIALAPETGRQIDDFVAQGGVVIADSEPGLFDEHGRRAATPVLAHIFDGPPSRSATRFAFGNGAAVYLPMANSGRPEPGRRFSDLLEAAGVRTQFPLIRPDGQQPKDIETYVFRNGEVTILALQRDDAPLSQQDTGETVILALPRALDIYDLRAQRPLGRSERLELSVDGVAPVLLAMTEKQISPPGIVGPRTVRRGDNAEFIVSSNAPAARGVIHLDVVDPDGAPAAAYSGNVLLEGGAGRVVLPLAVNDQTGVWRLRATDIASGQTTFAELEVKP